MYKRINGQNNKRRRNDHQINGYTKKKQITNTATNNQNAQPKEGSKHKFHRETNGFERTQKNIFFFWHYDRQSTKGSVSDGSFCYWNGDKTLPALYLPTELSVMNGAYDATMVDPSFLVSATIFFYKIGKEMEK